MKTAMLSSVDLPRPVGGHDRVLHDEHDWSATDRAIEALAGVVTQVDRFVRRLRTSED